MKGPGRLDAVNFELVKFGDVRLVSSTDLSVAVDQINAAAVDVEQSAGDRSEVLSFVAGHKDAAFRTCPSAHLTGSALVVDPLHQRTLLMLHRKLGRWFQPGGHADGDTNLAAVALREATEETGLKGLSVLLPAIDVDVHVVEPPKEPPHKHLDVRFIVLVGEDGHESANEESLALRWVGLDDLGSLEPAIDPGTEHLVRRGLALVELSQIEISQYRQGSDKHQGG